MITAVNAAMRALLRGDAPPASPFWGMLHYHMGWVDAHFEPVQGVGGKRLRPLICLLSAQAAGVAWQKAVPAGAAIELLHNFSLVHDDIQDASPTRHGRDTLWQLWGVAQAINAGDALFAFAHIAMAQLLDVGVPAPAVVRALRRFDETCLELTEGQYTDMDFEGRDDVGVDEYIRMITGKTAVLLSLCTELGALIAGRDDDSIAHFAAFGRDLGLAFQVLDDVLGIWGDEAVIGKSAQTDIATRKKSLPVLHGLAASPTLRDLYAQPDSGPAFVSAVVAELDRIGAREFAEAEATTYSSSALAHLEAARPVDPGATTLRNLAARMLRRQF